MVAKSECHWKTRVFRFVPKAWKIFNSKYVLKVGRYSVPILYRKVRRGTVRSVLKKVESVTCKLGRTVPERNISILV